MENQLTTVQPVLLESQPAVIKFNFDELNANVDKLLADYDNVVTADTVKSSKKQMAELNKFKKSISDAMKEAKAIVTAPVTEADAQVKAIIARFDEARTKIDEQVKAYEDEDKKAVLAKLEEERAMLWESEGVREEFRKCDVSGMVTLGGLTGKGALTSAKFREVQAAVANDKAWQSQTDLRLSQLENECYKNGLTVPLTRGHVESFLFASEDEYTQRLNALITQELERAKQIEERAKAQQEVAQKEQQRELEAKHQKELQEQQRKSDLEAAARQAEYEAQAARHAAVETTAVAQETELPAEPEPFHVQQSEDERRQHMKDINNEILNKLVSLMISPDDAKMIITYAANGKLGAMTVNYD